MHRYHRLLTLLLVQATYEPTFVAAFIGPDARIARPTKLAPSATFFDVLAEDTVLIDPADGTCCRNECASCSYHEEIDGEISYAFEEKTGGRWLPTQAETSVPPRLQTAKWVEVVFGEATNVTRDAFEAALDAVPAEEVDIAWRTLTSAPKLLRKNEVQSKLRAIAPNGVVDEAAWAAAAAETRAAPVVDVVDYDGDGGPQGAVQRPRHQAAAFRPPVIETPATTHARSRPYIPRRSLAEPLEKRLAVLCACH